MGKVNDALNCYLYMPFRVLEYDMEEYARQLRRLRRRYQGTKALNKTEFLSGIQKTDRLIPATTLVFYHGLEEWDTPTQLSDLYDTAALDESLSKLCLNHRIKLINLTDLDENNFETGLRELIGMMKRRNDKEQMWNYYHENKERFRHLDDETYDIICTMLNLKSLAAKKEHNHNSELEDNDMCKAFEDLMNDFMAKGKIEGKREGENMLAQLIEKLLNENRLDDIKEVTKDISFRNKMYQEYGIQ